MGKSRNIAWVFGAVMLVLIFIRPQQAVDGAQRAMKMWYTGVAPAMLPFLALMPLITCQEACAAYRKIFSGAMGKLFKLPGEAAPAVIAAMISGSPGGSIAACGILSSGGISNTEAARIMLAVSGVSPAWLVMGVGYGMLGSTQAGWKLAAIQLLVQLILLKLLEKVKIRLEQTVSYDPEHTKNNPVRSAVENTLSVCGYMCVFGAYGNIIASFAGKNISTALMMALDLPSGLGMIAEINTPWKMPASCLAIGFGGLCIAAQNMEKLKKVGLRWRDYIAARTLAASISGLLCVLIFKNTVIQTGITQDNGKIYVISLLAAAVFAVPGMIIFSKKYFLNKSKDTKTASEIH